LAETKTLAYFEAASVKTIFCGVDIREEMPEDKTMRNYYLQLQSYRQVGIPFSYFCDNEIDSQGGDETLKLSVIIKTACAWQ